MESCPLYVGRLRGRRVVLLRGCVNAPPKADTREIMKTGIDWNLLRIQYELFGETIDSLADQYDTTPAMIQYAVDEKGWQITPLAKAVGEWKEYENLEEMPLGLIEEVRDRMQILFTLKQSTLNPRYIAIETAILGKTQKVIESLNPEDVGAADILKNMTRIFVSLREAAGITGGRQEDQAPPPMQIQILTKVENGERGALTHTQGYVGAAGNTPYAGFAGNTPIDVETKQIEDTTTIQVST